MTVPSGNGFLPSYLQGMTQPTLYIPHGGGPCFFLNEDGSCPPMWRAMQDYLANLISSLAERPKAILLVSAHWAEPQFTVHVGERPGLLFDYYGFPQHTYDLRWDAPAAPDVARRAGQLLQQAGFQTAEESERGWDHGVFIPMMVALPDADIPVAQLSLCVPNRHADYDPALHIRAGQALAPLRDEGVLIIGSGMSFHNLRLMGAPVEHVSEAFDEALTGIVTLPGAQDRNAALVSWTDLPHARTAHPPHGGEDHLIPLMVAAGAAGEDIGVRTYKDSVLGWTVSGYQFG